jgi:large subunit ribosomal protein L28
MNRAVAGSKALTAASAFDYTAPSRAEGVPSARFRFLRSPVRDAPTKDLTMSRRCELTGVGPMVGHSVSHSNIKTKRRFLPSLKKVKLASEALGQSYTLRISNAALRTLDFKGGLDPFIVKAKDEQLSLTAQRIKRQVKAKLAEAAA